MEPRISVEFEDAHFWAAPVALISVGVAKPNFFTLGVMGGPVSNPPILTISPKPHTYSYSLIRRHGQFVVNFPTVDMILEMEYAGMYSGRDVNKWEKCGFTPIKGKVVDVPLIAECPVNLECVVVEEIRLRRDDGREASHIIVLGKVVQTNCHKKYFIDGLLQWDLIDAIFRGRPRTWRALGPVLGYDMTGGPGTTEPATNMTLRGSSPNPLLAPELINERTARLVDLALPIDRHRVPPSGPRD